MSIFQRFFGSSNDRKVKAMASRVAKINAFEPKIQALSDDELRAKTQEFKDRLAKGETLEDLLEEAFAVVREAAKRVLGQRHFDVQLVGGPPERASKNRLRRAVRPGAGRCGVGRPCPQPSPGVWALTSQRYLAVSRCVAMVK